jgi:hypothetical protein
LIFLVSIATYTRQLSAFFAVFWVVLAVFKISHNLYKLLRFLASHEIEQEGKKRERAEKAARRQSGHC